MGGIIEPYAGFTIFYFRNLLGFCKKGGVWKINSDGILFFEKRILEKLNSDILFIHNESSK